MKRPTDTLVKYLPQYVDKFSDFCRSNDDRTADGSKLGPDDEEWEDVIISFLDELELRSSDIEENVQDWQTNYDEVKEDARFVHEQASRRDFESHCSDSYSQLVSGNVPALLETIDKFEAFLKKNYPAGKCAAECAKLRERAKEFLKLAKETYTFVVPAQVEAEKRQEKQRRKSGKKKKSGAAKFFTFVLFCVTVFVVYKVYVAIKVAMQ